VEHAGCGGGPEGDRDDRSETRAGLRLANASVGDGQAVALRVGDIPCRQRTAYDATDDRADLVVDEVPTELDTPVDRRGHVALVSVLDHGKDLLASDVAELTARLASDAGGVSDELLLVLPELGGVVLQTTQLLLAL